ncbi:hypothetical protein CKAH01_15859 [Colletotrichum kahawae]|uniref:Uncharacterized protein n=1 Tax=Colletotrichum kahawae TaxID=34407 RepID=A0AAD9YJ78_COLKA|nr:hypothetical protein CKAH01_15859 [Colletotrichum kahawae]
MPPIRITSIPTHLPAGDHPLAALAPNFRLKPDAVKPWTANYSAQHQPHPRPQPTVHEVCAHEARGTEYKLGILNARLHLALPLPIQEPSAPRRPPIS